MERIEELLPGLEEFLTVTLAAERLSLFAEERRQFFVERLDIVKLPPTLPPREGRKLSPELLKETEERSGVLSTTASTLSSSSLTTAAAGGPPHHNASQQHGLQAKANGLSSSAHSGLSVSTGGLSTSTAVSAASAAGGLSVSSSAHSILSAASTSTSAATEGASLAPDFAATQREIARARDLATDHQREIEMELARARELDFATDHNPYEDEEEVEAGNTSLDMGGGGKDVKDKDEDPSSPASDVTPLTNGLDLPASGSGDLHLHLTNGHAHHPEAGEEEEDHYEVPVTHQMMMMEMAANAGSSHASVGDVTSIATAGSVEELPDEAEVFPTTNDMPPPVPPPLPRRRDIRFSDSGSRNSLNSPVEDKDRPPDLPFRPPLPKRNEMITKSSEKCDRSGRSDEELSGDSTSYESLPSDEEDHHDTNKHSIQLPRKSKKKSHMKSSKKLSKSRSSSQWEITVPFRKLVDLDISGELYHKGKLKWNRRLVAISNGCLCLYKPDKDGRPQLVLPLTGYNAVVGDREGRHGWEVRMTSLDDDVTVFSVDFKDWAHLWVEHINGNAKGEPPPKYHTHLARTFTGPPLETSGSKSDLNGSASNLSTGSEGAGSEDGKPKMRGKVMRMGSFAYRATQFFESIGKKSSGRRKISSMSYHGEHGDVKQGIQEESSMSSSNSANQLPLLSPTSVTSDVSSPVFSAESRSNSSQSIPHTPNSPFDPVSFKDGFIIGEKEEEDDDEMDAPEDLVTHKGFLYIYSSFKRRYNRWGKRWCMVRENTFECYRHRASSECELTFVLRSCSVRRATVETGSQLGLCILEGGREKIIVEPECAEEMGGWVRVLMSETETQDVPEGLEAYMEVCGNPEVSSLLSFTVLKQWDMDLQVPRSPSVRADSHEYEDPAEIQQTATNIPQRGPTIPTTPSTAGVGRLLSEATSRLTSAGSDGEVTLVGGSVSSLPVSPLSVTPSSSVTSFPSGFPRISDNLAAYNKHKQTTDSGFYSVKGVNSDSDSSCGGGEGGGDTGDIDSGYATLNSKGRRSKHSKTASNSGGDSKLSPTSPTIGLYPNTKKSPTFNRHAKFSPVTFNPSGPTSPTSVSAPMTFDRIEDEGHYDRLTPTPSSDKEAAAPALRGPMPKSPSGSSLYDNNGEQEYSVVVKRSSRSKSKSPDETPNVVAGEQQSKSSGGVTLCDNEKSADDQQIIQEESPEEPPLPPTPPPPTTDISHVMNLHPLDILNSSVDSEPVNSCQPSPSIASISSRLEQGFSALSSSGNSSSEPEQPPPRSTSLRRPSGDDLLTTSGAAPPLPNSPIPDLADTSQLAFDFGGLSADQKQAGEVTLRGGGRAEVCSSSESQQQHRSNVTSLDEMLLKTSEEVAAVTNNPEATEADITAAIHSLKTRLTQVKKRRMAVHDKRQRVTSDDQVLACEKEFAALDRAVETTDAEIGELQKKLDTIQGQTLEAMKAAASNSSKKKSGSSRKKKNKRK